MGDLITLRVSTSNADVSDGSYAIIGGVRPGRTRLPHPYRYGTHTAGLAWLTGAAVIKIATSRVGGLVVASFIFLHPPAVMARKPTKPPETSAQRLPGNWACCWSACTMFLVYEKEDSNGVQRVLKDQVNFVKSMV